MLSIILIADDVAPSEPSPEPMTATLMDLQLTKEEQTMESERDEKRRAHFYVYCDMTSCRFSQLNYTIVKNLLTV